MKISGYCIHLVIVIMCSLVKSDHIKRILLYSQTWVNDHLWITTTCLQQPLFWGPNFNFHNVKLPLSNDHLSTTATNFGSRGWSLYTSLTVFLNFEWQTSKSASKFLYEHQGGGGFKVNFIIQRFFPRKTAKSYESKSYLVNFNIVTVTSLPREHQQG